MEYLIVIGPVLLAHLVGDYLIQSHWMAKEKTSRWGPAIVHGLTYAIPFVFVTTSPAALAVIAGTHVLIDRYRLARYLVWLRNQIAPKAARYRLTTAHGGPKEQPDWLAYWLLFIADNVAHIIINLAAVWWL